MPSSPTILTIAGFDPSSGAGVTADLMVFAAHGLFGTSCITALTVQSTLGVRSSEPVSAEIVRATLDCLHTDLPPIGIKIGMLATAANVAAVADYLETIRVDSPGIPVVLDPVVRASSEGNCSIAKALPCCANACCRWWIGSRRILQS